jgi:hypothetical protein
MENDIETALAGIIEELETRRALWRNVRDERLKLKRELEASGLDKTAVRKDLEHRRLHKEQDRLSTIIKHIEKRLNRKRANLGKKETRP